MDSYTRLDIPNFNVHIPKSGNRGRIRVDIFLIGKIVLEKGVIRNMFFAISIINPYVRHLFQIVGMVLACIEMGVNWHDVCIMQ
jgi:hypothetical protein